MNGTEIIAYLSENFQFLASAVSAVAGGLFTAIFLRHNTATKEFEKIKAGHFKDVADELLKSGEMTHTEYYKATNFLTVAQKADKYYAKLPQRDSFDAYDFDWFIRFYEAVGNISNEEMQELWAKILAGEISHPSTYSLRTIDVLKNLSKTEASLFEKVCLHSIQSNGKYFLPRYNEYLEKNAISYSDIMLLSELGLMYNNGAIVLSFKPQIGTSLLLSNRDLVMTCTSSSEVNNTIAIDQYPFTQVGYEIASLKGYCASNDDFLLFAKQVSVEIADFSFGVYRIISRNDNQIQSDSTDLLADEISSEEKVSQ